MSITPIVKQDLVFWPLPPGKPDPQKTHERGEAPLEDRVVQSGSKEDLTDFYYACNFLRQRIGKKPSESQKGDREIEINISQWRKTMTGLLVEVTQAFELTEQLGGPIRREPPRRESSEQSE